MEVVTADGDIVSYARGRDPDFLEEFAAEIRLVAFDQLLYHLEAAHSQSAELPAEG